MDKIKEFFTKLIKDKFKFAVYVTYAVTFIVFLISTAVQEIIWLGLFCLAASCFLTAVNYIIKYKKIGKDSVRDYLPMSSQEVKKENKGYANQKRDCIVRIIMFIGFGIALIIFGINLLK